MKLTDFVAVPRAAWSEGEGADREAADELRGVPAVLRVGKAATRGQRPGQVPHQALRPPLHLCRALQRAAGTARRGVDGAHHHEGNVHSASRGQLAAAPLSGLLLLLLLLSDLLKVGSLAPRLVKGVFILPREGGGGCWIPPAALSNKASCSIC